MTDSFVRIPADSDGKRLDAEELTVGGITVYRERLQLAGAADDDIAVVIDTDPSAADHGIATREIGPVNPIADRLSSVDLAAGASINLDGSFFASGTTGKLMMVTLSSTVACRWDIKTLDAAVEVALDVMYTSGLWGKPTSIWRPPHKEFATLAYGDGDETFRITAENLDSAAADVTVTMFRDEV